MLFKFAALAAVSYLLGSINSAIIVSRLFLHDDIRKYGSKNAGMTNVLRVMGGKIALLVVLGDVSKGALSVAAAIWMFKNDSAQVLTYAKLAAAIFAVTGHMFPLYFRFKGGKGVLTAAAAFLVFDWRVLTVLLVIFFVVYFPLHYISLSSIIAAAVLPFLMHFYYHDLLITGIGTLIGSGVIVMHRSNIKRLINKKETKTNLFKKKTQ